VACVKIYQNSKNKTATTRFGMTFENISIDAAIFADNPNFYHVHPKNFNLHVLVAAFYSGATGSRSDV
jgi:hypothetical protein